MLLAEEYFSAEDDRFVDAIRGVMSPAALAGFGDRWTKDPRDWARRQQLAYLAHDFDRPGHNILVKHLFKQAEAAGDDELMARFLVCFDRLIRRRLKTRYRYDWRSGDSWREEYLAAPRNILPLIRGGRQSLPDYYLERLSPDLRLFSVRTRHYMRRRSWRYFRRLGYQHPERYVRAIAVALMQYEDDDLKDGLCMIDAWGLMQACFRHHDALTFRPSSIQVNEGRSLNELTPAPRFQELWSDPSAAVTLLSLVTDAAARLVRLWAMQLLKREHAARLAELPASEIVRLLSHEDEEVQGFAAELLEACGPDLAKLPVATWLELLKTPSPAAIERITALMLEHVAGDRIDLSEGVRLACAEPAPVARLGFHYLKERTFSTPEDREAVCAVTQTRCNALAAELAEWALPIVGAADVYDRDLVLRFFDSLQRPVRRKAWDWLCPPSEASERCAGYDDPGLWVRLLETPYDETRLRMIDELQRRAALPGAGPRDLTPVWCSVLLGVHRGNREKRKSLEQMTRAIVRDPDRAAELLPILTVAVRSIRPAESRAGLAAVVTIVESRPELTPLVREILPELEFAVAPGVEEGSP